MPDKLVQVAQVQPGQMFMFGGVRYVRATEPEVVRHPASELTRRKGPLVLAYGLDNKKRTPVSFLETVNLKVVLV